VEGEQKADSHEEDEAAHAHEIPFFQLLPLFMEMKSPLPLSSHNIDPLKISSSWHLAVFFQLLFKPLFEQQTPEEKFSKPSNFPTCHTFGAKYTQGVGLFLSIHHNSPLIHCPHTLTAGPR
jgi:hypothetical protein